MVPLGFPVLLPPGAFVLDLVLKRFSRTRDLWKAAIAAAGFLASSVAVNWPFAYFMMSPYARNRVFGMSEFPYNFPPSQYHLAWELQSYEKTRMEFWIGMGIALVATAISARIGMLWGDWMHRIRR